MSSSVADVRLKHEKTWIAFGFGFVVLVIYLSLTPNPLDVNPDIGIKLDHALAYGWMMFWFAQIVRRAPSRIGVALALLALGIALEYGQRWTGYRHFSYYDMRDDALGITLGFLVGLTRANGMLALLERRLMK